MLAKNPSSLSYAEAASVPVVAVTAWQGLFDHARLEAGQTVVIHGAAGNVGAYAVQLARRARLRSIATAGAKDIEYVRSLGADKVLDYHTQRFEEEVKDADAVLDLVGGETQMRSFQVLRPGGKLISAVSQPDQDRAKHHGVTAAFFLVEVTAERLRTIAELIDRGELKTCVGAVLPLTDARDAHMMLEGRRLAAEREDRSQRRGRGRSHRARLNSGYMSVAASRCGEAAGSRANREHMAENALALWACIHPSLVPILNAQPVDPRGRRRAYRRTQSPSCSGGTRLIRRRRQKSGFGFKIFL